MYLCAGTTRINKQKTGEKKAPTHTPDTQREWCEENKLANNKCKRYRKADTILFLSIFNIHSFNIAFLCGRISAKCLESKIDGN